jgi:hypothetical protein
MTCVYGCSGTMCAACPQKSPSNLLPNPGFDGSVTPWETGITHYSSYDFDSCANSGSYNIDYEQDMGACVSTTPGTRYYATFKFRARPGESSLGYCAVYFRPMADCTGSGIGSIIEVSVTSSDGAWVSAVPASGVAPAGAMGMRFGCTGSVGRGFYDKLYLGTSATDTF